MSMETIGFIGLGNMGAPMAGRLLDAGYGLIVHDLRRAAAAPLLARGARWAGSPSGVAATEIYRMAVARGMGDLDHTAVARLIEEWAGIELRSKPGDPK
jgi:3-hydroxyisobutyrate dehydrogenase-like beta-hydroxyacid dehydrogenase